MKAIRGPAVAIAASALVFVGASLASANLIVNGSFETPAPPLGSFTNYNSGSVAIPGWTVVGPQVSVVSTTFTQAGFAFPAQDGAAWLDLTGLSSNAVEGVEQTVATTAGATYQLSFWVGDLSFGAGSTVNVFINGVSAGSFTNNTPGRTLNWMQFTLAVLASSAQTTIRFLNADGGGDNSNGLDNVVFEQVATGEVPLPASGLLLLTALPLLARRRKFWA